MSREESEKLLGKEGQNQAYLVRQSAKHQTYTLDLRIKICGKFEFRHYIIYRRGIYYQLNNGPLMATLEHLIDYYRL